MGLLYGLLYILLYMSPLFTTEYVYPIASLDDSTVLYIHQVSPENIQLFSYNTITNRSEQMIWSVFNPAGVQVLPNNKGFSFIDNGRLRIKSFQKRSPKTVDFDEPIYNINGLCWIDEHTCYCSAYYNNKCAIFELNDSGDVHHVMEKINADCMYPQKVNNHLFYIERYKKYENNNYTIMQTWYKNNSTPEVLMSFNDNPIIFLHMISETEGFVIQHQKNIADEARNAKFQYHHILKKADVWDNNVLFSFEIPTYLFLYDNDQRLFESILPLLPKLIDKNIYFVDCLDDQLEPYCYNLATMKSTKINIAKQKGHIFVPIKVGTDLWSGGTNICSHHCPFFIF